ncbi:hypothetical protein F5883DRAFT_239938 [Diaporthe sp. PMI_573]|nr:hypothetical protein F5883DRAFT_239938 [Diaporthaceae sp. PMI_573]
MHIMAYTCLSRQLVAVFILCALQAAGGLAMPTSTTTSTPASPQWPSLLETARLFVSRWLNETTAIIAIGVIVGLAAASFAVFGLEWKDYDQDSLERFTIEEERVCQDTSKHAGVWQPMSRDSDQNRWFQGQLSSTV